MLDLTEICVKKRILIVGICLLAVLAIIVALFTSKFKIPRSKVYKEVPSSKEELHKKLDFDLIDPIDSSEIRYGIENSSIAKVTYKKVVTDGIEMNFILRASYSTEDIENSIGLDVEFPYTPILMTVICSDGSEITVESRVAVDPADDEMRYMKALWFDNDKYYSMVTDNLVTREDFLQEVNRVIIANHLSF